jgi:hypothetical protein
VRRERGKESGEGAIEGNETDEKQEVKRLNGSCERPLSSLTRKERQRVLMKQ